MMIHRILSALLSYPQDELLEALPEIREALGAFPLGREQLEPLLEFLKAHTLIELQENYVATFDRNPSHSLHLFEHVHGESRDRGQAMVDLLDTYRRRGFEPAVPELPDHVPLFLEFLSLLPKAEAQTLLDDAIHVLAAVGSRLARGGSPYAAVFVVLRDLATVTPREHEPPPVRDMDEALEIFGPGPDGVEPLLRPRRGHIPPLRPRPGVVPR
ncbi:MAG: nitrate reductase molybdenum cofactor assembly chaperone [Burkholderiaceae bacterium]